MAETPAQGSDSGLGSGHEAAARSAGRGVLDPGGSDAYHRRGSNAFTANQPIPVEYTCDGADASPELSWSAPPSGTRSVALLVDDPDAPRGVFTHWLVTGLPPGATELARNASLPMGAVAGKNDFGKLGYKGPCPPRGATHHYHVRVFALDSVPVGSSKRDDLMSAIRGHVVAQGELIGTYQRRP